MRSFRVVATGVLFVCSWALADARAEGLIYKLPEDGAWVRYASEGKAVDKVGDVQVHVTGNLTMRSVGRETVNNEACRWLEIETTAKFKQGDSEREITELYKLLIPEKYLRHGEDPRDHVIDARVKRIAKSPNGEVHEADQTGTATELIKGLDEFFQPPLSNATSLPALEIDSKLGKLSCAGQKVVDGKGLLTEVRLHDKAPFGVVTFLYKKTRPDGSMRTMTLKLSDFGTGSKTKPHDSK